MTPGRNMPIKAYLMMDGDGEDDEHQLE